MERVERVESEKTEREEEGSARREGMRSWLMKGKEKNGQGERNKLP